MTDETSNVIKDEIDGGGGGGILTAGRCVHVLPDIIIYGEMKSRKFPAYINEDLKRIV